MATALAKTRRPSPFSAGASSSPAAGWRRTAKLEQSPTAGPAVNYLLQIALLHRVHRWARRMMRRAP